MNRSAICIALAIQLSAATCSAARIAVDTSGVRDGPISVNQSDAGLNVIWKDSSGQTWRANFSLDPTKPLIHSIAVNGNDVVRDAKPIYRCAIGKRTGGWDVFFDNPSTNSEGTRHFVAEFQPTAVTVRSIGNRVELTFDGMRMGIFEGTLRYDFYPETALIQQIAVLKTSENDVAYYYDSGLDFAADEDRTVGGNMASGTSYYDADGTLQTITPSYGSERHTMRVHYRAISARTGSW